MRKDFIYLASASPRRRALLAQINVPFRVREPDIDERRLPEEPPDRYVLRVATAKAEAVWRAEPAAERRPVLAADTVVVLEGRTLGKPVDERAAVAMLGALSGRSHEVLTAVVLRGHEHTAQRLSVSEVRMRAISEAERHAYCRGGEPLDKAGAYGIQGQAAVFVESMRGSYSGVMGLPLYETACLLEHLRLPGWLYDEASVGA
jgi:septum formation protein